MLATPSNLAILVLSCNKYSDLWDPFFYFFFKYWTDCPYKVYLSSNSISYNNSKVSTISSGESTNWSREATIVLNQIKEDYVLIILEDYFIYKNVDQVLVEKCFKYLKDNNGLFFRLAIFPKNYSTWWNYSPTTDKQIGKIQKNELYPINLQVGIWSKKGLLEIIKEGESPWKFEIEGSKRIKNTEMECFCLIDNLNLKYVHGPITYLCSAVSQGKWMKDAVFLAKKEGIHLDTSKRRIESRWEFFKRRLYLAIPLKQRKYIDYFKKYF